ncbi:MAG: sigma-70 family RNA polymerase sigma factor [Erysipelotrichales bacterium]|nr:sigma-70 family RNA polymerase sigma factor [Erysipelotrichales bacterium]
MAGMIKYQISKTRFIWVATATNEELKLIKHLNNEFDKERKKEKTYKKNTISLNMLEEKCNFEYADSSDSPEEFFNNEFRNNEIMKAIRALPMRQKQVILEFFYNDKSLRQIARENNVSISTIRESFHSALKTLRKKLQIFAE